MSVRTRVPALAIGALIAFAPPAAAITAEEQAFVDAVNASRTAAGLAPLTYSEELSLIADRHSADMAGAGTIWHSTNLAGTVGSVYPNWTRIGENVGKGSTVESIHSAMLASPSHAANIYGDYNLLGVGVETNPGGVMFVTEVFAKAVVESAVTAVPTTKTVAAEPALVPVATEPVATAAGAVSPASSTKAAKPVRTAKSSSTVSRVSNAGAMGAARSAAGLGGRHGPPEWAQNERSGR